MIRKIGSCGSDNGQFINPEGVTFDSKNVLYVVDCGNNRVQIFDVNGNYVMLHIMLLYSQLCYI